MKTLNRRFFGLALTAMVLAGGVALAAVTINGAGATFPYPLYSKWAYLYEQKTQVKVNYQSIGSGGGIAQIKAKTVDFGASDAPLKKEELDQAGLVQFPLTMGGVVPAINLAGVTAGQLVLSGPVLADIYLGKIASWDDPAVVKLNPGVKIPNQKIVVVHRADGSGTTWIFTSYLAKVSPEWEKSVGCDKAVAWPTGIAGKGNEGVAAYVKQVPGAIGYVEYAYAIENKINFASLINRAGKTVKPTIETFQAAAANADWKSAPAFYMVLTDQPGDNSWPVTGASFILVYKDQPDAARAKEMLKFFDWCLKNGAETAKGLHYVPLPNNLIALIEEMWAKEIKSGGKPVWP
jgi:phosphate transport system substrate-binding protein